MKWRASRWGGIVVAGGVVSVLAEKPQIDGIFPAGGQHGTEFEVTVIGKFEPWPLRAVCDEARISFSPSEKDKGKYQVKVAAEVEPGAYLVRFHNKEGATAPRQFVVGAQEERAQVGVETMTIPVADFPLTVNGKLESGGEVDRFAFDLQAGQVLVAEVTAYALDSPLDPLLHVRGPRGEQLAFNHDATRLGLDPRLVFTAPMAGQFELHLSAHAYPPKADIRFAGSATSIYRLNLGHDPPTIDLPPPHESESEGPQRIEIPSSIGGRINPAGDVDRFIFAAKKGEAFSIEVVGTRIGSWIDPVLVIEDGAGKELKREDDSDGIDRHDVRLDWTAPEEGDYTARVTDLNGNGGSEIAYQFRIKKPAPGFAATAPGGVYAIRAGEKLEIAVKVARRDGHKGELEVGIKGLPPGVTAAPVAVNEKGEAKLNLEATAEAALASVAITIWAEPKGEPEKREQCRFELKGATTESGHLLINDTERGWLTVLEKKK